MGINNIIPAYNSKDTLLNTLPSIIMQKDLERINIQVTIENNFSDYSYSNLADYFSSYINIQEVVTNKNVSSGETRNLGLKSTKEEYIIFIDNDDCFYGTNSIRTLEGLKRNCDKKDIVSLAMKSLISMYYSYIELYNKYDVSPIIKWSKPILEKYNKFPVLRITQNEINIFIKLKKQSYLNHNIELDKKLTFTEFLSKINELK